MLVIENIAKRFGATRVLRGASLALERGDIVALTGANGAGKSTLLQIASGILDADSGRIAIDHRDLRKERVLALRALGFAPEHADLPPHLRAREWMDLVSAVKKAPGEDLEFASVPVGELSLGQKRRLLLACAFMGKPKVLVLDEPTNGLDAGAIATLESRIARHDGAVLVTTHDRDFARRIRAKVVVLENGTVR